MSDDQLINHKYTVLEIEYMRGIVDQLLHGTNNIWYPRSGPEYPSSKEENENRVERQLKTYMLAGVRPEELQILHAERLAVAERERAAAYQETNS